jgi:hypothetical protein
LTHGLAAIVEAGWPSELPSSGRIKSASGLLDVIDSHPPVHSSIDVTGLRDAVERTDPQRHSRTSGLPVEADVAALVALDGHPAIGHAYSALAEDSVVSGERAGALEREARSFSQASALVDRLTREGLARRAESAGYDYAPVSAKDALDAHTPIECLACGLETFLVDGWGCDFEAQGAVAVGLCVACGFQRDQITADELADDAYLQDRLDRS